MSKVHKVDYDPKDLLVDITGMKGLDIAVYWVICSLIIADNRPVYRDDERIFGVFRKDHPNAIAAAIERLIERWRQERPAGIGLTPEGHLTQTRATREVDAAKVRMERARDASDTRWGSEGRIHKKQRVKNATASTPAKPSLPPLPSPDKDDGKLKEDDAPAEPLTEGERRLKVLQDSGVWLNGWGPKPELPKPDPDLIPEMPACLKRTAA